MALKSTTHIYLMFNQPIIDDAVSKLARSEPLITILLATKVSQLIFNRCLDATMQGVKIEKLTKSAIISPKWLPEFFRNTKTDLKMVYLQKGPRKSNHLPNPGYKLWLSYDFIMMVAHFAVTMV